MIKCLAPIWNDITYITRGRKFDTVETSFKTAKKAHEHSVAPLKTNERVLLPVYMGQYTSRFKIAEVLPERSRMSDMRPVNQQRRQDTRHSSNTFCRYQLNSTWGLRRDAK